MFKYYLCYYDGQYVGKFCALSEKSAIDKCAQLIHVSASAYSGLSRRLITAVKI